MSPESDDPTGRSLHRLAPALQFGIGVGLVAFGLARFTDTIAWEPPAVVYLAVGICLLAYGVVLLTRL